MTDKFMARLLVGSMRMLGWSDNKLYLWLVNWVVIYPILKLCTVMGVDLWR